MATNAFDLNDLKRRMQGALASLKQELSGLRTGRASSALARSPPSGGLWQPYAAQSAGDDQRSGTAAAQCPGLGPLDGPCGREGDLRRQSRIDAVDRGAGSQTAHSRTERGAATGNRQGGAQIRRIRARCGAPRPPRRARPAQEAGKGAQDQRGRSRAPSRRGAESNRRLDCRGGEDCWPARKRRS